MQLRDEPADDLHIYGCAGWVVHNESREGQEEEGGARADGQEGLSRLYPLRK